MDKTIVAGRIVHYMISDVEIRPGIVVSVIKDNPDGLVNLQVFIDGTNVAVNGVNAGDMTRGLSWRTSVPYSSTWKKETWHWPRDLNPSMSYSNDSSSSKE